MEKVCSCSSRTRRNIFPHDRNVPITEAQVLDALRSVHDPDLHRDVVSLGFIKDVRIVGGSIGFTLELTTPACPVRDVLEQQVHAAVMAIEGVEEVDVTVTARVRPRDTAPADLLPNVRQIIAIASGKGGVGKSTVTVNLAAALAREGARVGLLDADVYGPSIPLMMGADGEQPLTRNSKILPIYRHGVGLMSLGFLLQEGQAVLWRGPMVAATVKQLLSDVEWGELDYLLVDLPPGTGDAPMSLAQLVPLTGVVVVTTPHSVAANIAGKASALFRRLNTPLLGVVENMGGYVCEHCGQVTRLFAGQDGADLAQQLGVEFLGSIPLDPAVSAAAEQGVPSIIAAPDRPQATAFETVAGNLARMVSVMAVSREG